MSFIAYVNQTDYGCDYTIACGKTLWKLKAGTRIEALEELKKRILGTFMPDRGDWDEGCWGDGRLKCVTLFEIVKEESVPVSVWYAEAEQMSREAVRCLEVAEERRQYVELRRKYG